MENNLMIMLGILILAFAFLYYVLPIILQITSKWLMEDVTLFHIHDWKYSKKKGTIPDRDIEFNIPIRKCTKCGQKQYRTMLPMCNGYDSNKWKNYYEDDLKIE